MGNAYNDLKKKIKKLSRNIKKSVYNHFGESESSKRGNSCGNNGMPPNGWFPYFFKGKSPWTIVLLCPKAIILYIILATLLLCGVSFYGLVVLVLLAIIFILI